MFAPLVPGRPCDWPTSLWKFFLNPTTSQILQFHYLHFLLPLWKFQAKILVSFLSFFLFFRSNDTTNGNYYNLERSPRDWFIAHLLDIRWFVLEKKYIQYYSINKNVCLLNKKLTYIYKIILKTIMIIFILFNNW